MFHPDPGIPLPSPAASETLGGPRPALASAPCAGCSWAGKGLEPTSELPFQAQNRSPRLVQVAGKIRKSSEDKRKRGWAETHTHTKKG